MGNVNDKFSSTLEYQRRINEVDLEKFQKLAELDKLKNAHQHELDRQNVKMGNVQVKAQNELRKAEMILKFQDEMRKIEAELFQTRMQTQTSLFSKFVDYMKETLNTNTALIEQQMQLYSLIEQCTDVEKVNYFMQKADQIKIMDAQALMDAGHKKLGELNLENSEETKYLVSILEKYGAITFSNHLRLNPSSNNIVSQRTTSSYSQKELGCNGRACVTCGYCRDWYHGGNSDPKLRNYQKRHDATCEYSYAGGAGYRGYNYAIHFGTFTGIYIGGFTLTGTPPRLCECENNIKD